MYHGTLEHVSINDIVIDCVLGEGRNGACFKVKWNGVDCAMKQFDIGRDGDVFFKREIQAYMLLQKAWGILVPKPMFISETFSGGTVFLGLQLGHESTNIDDLAKFHDVLDQLEKEYGIRHKDAERGRNMLIITDTNGVERVVAIDFEDWDEVRC
jgi:predicted Ser/Thr protein kinase